MDSGTSLNNLRDSTSRNSSLARLSAFKPSGSYVQRWLNNQSTPMARERALPPSQFHAPSHMQNPDAAVNQDSQDDIKKQRRLSVASIRSAIGSKRNSIVASGHGIANRFSAIYHRMVIPSDGSTTAQSTMQNSSQSSLAPLLAPLKNDGLAPSMRFVFVGNSGCGKSTLLMRSYTGNFMDVGNQEDKDTSGDIELNQLKSLSSYLAFDAVFLCFSLDDTVGFIEGQGKWISSIEANCPDVPTILLGLKKDTCFGSGMRAPAIDPHLFSSTRVPANQSDTDVTIMKSTKYIECSAKTGYNVERVFQEGAKLVLAKRKEPATLTHVHEEVTRYSGRHDNMVSMEERFVAMATTDKASRRRSQLFCFT
ncbi:P-loop containing nucleoside triphosphate hydrolase protein [Annulohypoxylon stygium]|nr:P-loop containing nucleoside triphosphate hydrolase protein [Annulohypoxylon stygium]